MSNFSDPALTYTLQDFIEYGKQDDMTYENFSILRVHNDIRFVEQNILDFYLEELQKLCVKVTDISQDEILKYKYSPDILAYDIYGSTQLDFVVLYSNNMIDPKDFNFKSKYLMLPRKQILKEFLSSVYNSEREWININRSSI